MTPAELLGLRRVVEVRPSPCGTWLAVSARERDGARWVDRLWRVSFDGAAPRLLGQGRCPRFRADGALSAVVGDDPAQVHLLESGTWRALSTEPLGVLDHEWAGTGLVMRTPVLADAWPDQARQPMAASTVLRFRELPVLRWDRWWGPGEPHLVWLDERGGRTDLTPRAGHALRDATWAVSPDGEWAAVAWEHSRPDGLPERALVIVHLADGTQVELLGGSGVVVARPCWSPDGRRIAVQVHQRSVDRHGPKRLVIVETDGAEARPVARRWDRWPEPVGWTADGGAVVVVARDRFAERLFRVDARTGKVSRLSRGGSAPPHVGGSYRGAVVTEGRIVAIHHALDCPPEVVVLDEEGRPSAMACVSSVPSLPDAAITAHLTRAPSGREVPWALIAPTGRRRIPVLLMVHGGPVGHWCDGWNWRWSPWPFVSAGIGVALPNPRGSTGYGQEWVEALWAGDPGEACAEDVLAVADALQARGHHRLGLVGGSFGGYLVSRLAGTDPRWRCAICHAGLFRHSMMYGSCDTPGELAWHLGADVHGDSGHPDRHSPTRFVHRWIAPTLLTHGALDHCVPVGQGMALFQVLRHHGVYAELLVFPDGRHRVEQPHHVQAWYEAAVEFATHHLRGGVR